MIVSQIFGIVMIGCLAVVAREIFFLDDKSGLAVERTGARHKGGV